MRIFNIYFFALDFDKASEASSVACHQCQAVKSIPVYLRPQSSTQAPTLVGSSFAADVIRRYRQHILVLRETVSSYTLSSLIDGERHDQLHSALLSMCAELRLLGDNPITVRVDPAPGFVALVKDSDLARHGIRLEIGHVTKAKKPPVAEHAISQSSYPNPSRLLSPTWNTIRELGIAVRRPTKRGCRVGRQRQHQQDISTLIGHRPRQPNSSHTNIESTNLPYYNSVIMHHQRKTCSQ